MGTLIEITPPPTFFYFGKSYFGIDLENTSFWSAGDDWLVFQEYSREIVVNGKWIVAGESIFYFRPGIIYIFAIFQISILIRFSSKTNKDRRIRGLGPLKNCSARSGDHFGPVKIKFRQI